MRALSLALVLVVTAVVAGCDLLGLGQDATLVIQVSVGRGSTQWPLGSTTFVETNGAVDDQKGFAGLEIATGGAIPRRVFAATDFVDYPGPSFTVPDAGEARVAARLVQDGQIVAEGSVSWPLQPEFKWRLHVDRAPYPPSEALHGRIDLDDPQCSFFCCHRIWRFAIAEEFANYEHEALWLTLYRGGCSDIKFG